MKLSLSTLGCPGWSWGEIFATAKDLGMNGIEVRGVANEMFAPRIPVFTGEKKAQTLEKIKTSGMEISMLTSGACLGGDNIDAFMEEAKAYIDMAQEIGVPYVRVMVSSVPQPTGEEDLEQTREKYAELCKYAEGKNVKALIETNGILANSDVLAELMRSIDSPAAGVLWDIHHPYRYYRESPQKTYENLKDWICYCHVKDSVMVDDKVEYRMMGYGDVPIFDTLKILKDHGYEGFITLEWTKRWCPDLQEPGIVFAHYATYMRYLMNQL
ncbi:MAG: sugar phosphate isomerase/epimerase [Oscillospiraceae bacterium]|nr:sugar phosphate isomerase/epimerase [Oscillospiraceae bacterium]MBR2636759.1 sugar phosphate isomerase/epimerase [Oscillospiraceae bacterium]MBR6608122.1 sugar phosphate isomerase/epimerase [Oscillospiraceae bacterium]